MPGMACWTGSFANAAGRAQLEAQIKGIEAELIEADAAYQELNVERERKLADSRAVQLVAARDQAAKLSNKVLDAQKRESKASTALTAAQAGSDTTAITAA